jgi:hypothetical protein
LLPAAPINVPAAVFTLVVLVQSLNPHIESPAVALIGIRTWLFYLLLYYVAIERFETKESVRRLVWFILAVSILICAFAMYQYFRGPDALREIMPDTFAQSYFGYRSAYGDRLVYRPNATFSYGIHFAMYLACITFLSAGLALRATGVRRLALGALTIALLGVNLIEGQRTLFILIPPALIAIVWMTRGFAAAFWVTVLSVCGLVPVLTASDPGVFERVVEVIGNQGGVVDNRIQAYTYYMTRALDLSPIGLGTGATAIGARYVLGELPVFLEFAMARVIAELSLVGLAVYFWLMGALLVSTFGVYRRLQAGGAWQDAAIVAAVFAFQLVVLYMGYDLAVTAVLVWLLSGAVLGLRETGPLPNGEGVGTRVKPLAAPPDSSLALQPLAPSRPPLRTGPMESI